MFGSKGDKKNGQIDALLDYNGYSSGLLVNSRKRYVFYPDSGFKSYWNMILTILLLYTASYMPYGIAFTD